MLRRIIFLPIFVFYLNQSHSQNSKDLSSEFVVTATINVNPGERVYVPNKTTFTAFVVSFNAIQRISTSSVSLGKDEFFLSRDEHFQPTDNKAHSNLISINTAGRDCYFNSGELEGEVVLYFINSGKWPEVDSINLNKSGKSGCEEPSSIDQNIWRSGLPEPNYARIYTETSHVIIHHSAGSNTNANYTQVVRDIYIYHTQVNGWSDIGYNYLIAQNGQVYKGRDPLTGEQDLVQGAHFCGKNSNTMGICLLGNYTSIRPTSSTLNSLMNLLSWKLNKDELDPLAFMNTNGISKLGVIAGHRDGCSTECPGEITYSLIDSIRGVVNQIILDCNGEIKNLKASFYGFPLEIEEGEYVSFVNNSTGPINNLRWVFSGGNPFTSTKDQPGQVQYTQSGLYDVSLTVYNEASNLSDELILENYVQVKERFAPKIAPNPLQRPYIAQINNISLEYSYQIQIHDQLGRLIDSFYTGVNNNELDFSEYNSGIYIITIRSLKQSETIRLVII